MLYLEDYILGNYVNPPHRNTCNGYVLIMLLSFFIGDHTYWPCHADNFLNMEFLYVKLCSLNSGKQYGMIILRKTT